MATYPLKNISIGGNTYQIQGGEFYVIEVGVQGYSAGDFAAFPQSTNITSSSTVTVYDKDNNVISGFDWSKLASAPCIAHIITSGSDGNIDSFAGLIGIDANQYPTLYSASFESDWKSPSSVPTRYGVRIDILQNKIDEVRGYAIQVGAGGGGGGSAKVLNLTDGQGNPIRFDHAQQAGTVQLQLSGTAQDFSHVSALLQAGTVIIKDSVGSLSPIECTHSSSTTLIVSYFEGNSMTRLKLAHQWSGNYGVSAMK